MIYLDYQATTPLAPEAREAMVRQLDGPDGTSFGNPHSSHRLGRQAKAVVETARERIAALLPPGGTLIFTSGATEALNAALRGTGCDVVTFATEHAAVLDCKRPVADEGYGFEVMPVTREGLADVASVDKAAALDTSVIAAMAVNNEIGVRHPLDEIAKVAQANDAGLVVDAVQAFGRIDLTTCPADMIAISAHKIHGPKGIGALWLRDANLIETFQYGGGQEAGLRSGTLSPALCAGFGAAAQLAGERMEQDADHIEALWTRARDLFGDWTLNGSAEARWHGNLNIRREGLDVARLMSDCRNIMFSAGSACASGSGRTSHVLKAIGLSDAEAKSSIRIGFGRYTTMEELEQAAGTINTAAHSQAV